MFTIAFAWTTHKFTIDGYDTLTLLADLFHPITENQFKIFWLYNAEESVKGIIAQDNF
ncbi:hypothetical protein [Bacteroides faecalis]|uniref:Uncharacterized protein n=1 Tax=Bacteroides faecalis TaxID=2447885 RepID=A0A401LPD0_9BACE|nr:hypothetical protein KGMB02408_03410 [Bacteroides faecalis]